MTDTRCECCDLPIEQCGRAAAEAAAAEARALRERALQHPRTFEARYPGVCIICGSRFAERDPVRYIDAERGYASALCCPEVVLA